MKQLLDYIDSENVAQMLDEPELGLIADRVIENYDKDWDSMSDYVEVTKAGLELAKPDMNARTTPWQGAANYKSSALISACVGFGDRASMELLSKKKDLFMLDIVGKDDEQRSKRNKANRIQAYENYNLLYGMPDWVDEQARLLYTLPAYGTVFKKVYYDPIEGRTVTCSINFPNFAVNQANKSLDTAWSFTEVHNFTPNDVRSYVRMGWWLDSALKALDGEQTGDNDADDDDDIYLEQYCYWDMDDDGYDEPYLVMVHKRSQTVCRIVAAYDKSTIIFKNGKVISDLQTAEDMESLDAVLATGKLVRIGRKMDVVKYGFIKSPMGDFLDVGYYYMLSSKAQLINTTTNQLLDSGTLANLPAGFLSREHRQRKGDTSFRPGEFKQTDIPAVSLQSSVMKVPVAEPSQALMVLNETTKKELADFAASLDMEGLLGSHVSATSALVASQEALIPHSAIMNGVLRAQSKEFQLLKDLTPEYLTDAEYSLIVGEQASVADDYSDSAVIMATAQSNMNNVVVEMYRSEALMGMIPTILQAGGNVIPIIQKHIKQVGGVDMDDIFKPMSEEGSYRDKPTKNKFSHISDAAQYLLLGFYGTASNADMDNYESENHTANKSSSLGY